MLRGGVGDTDSLGFKLLVFYSSLEVSHLEPI